MLRLAALLGLLALGVSGCALTGRSFARWGDDKALTARVKAKIVAVSLKNLSRVNVDIHDRVVYLSGVVDSGEAKTRTEEAARRVEGVRHVVSNLVPQDASAVSALPVGVVQRPVPAALVGVARIDGTRAYDEAGTLVATVYTVPMAELAQSGTGRFTAAHPIDHVTVHAVDADSHVPTPHYLVVLWHVPEAPRARPSAKLARPE